MPYRQFLCFILSALLLPFGSGIGNAQTTVGYLIQTVAGGNWAGDGGPATAALINHLEGIAADPRGGFYFADSDDHRVRKVLPNGQIQTIAGTGTPGARGDGGAANLAQLKTPYGVAADRYGNLYIADLGNARIRRVAADGSIGTVAGGGSLDGGSAEGGPATLVRLDAPRNVAVDAAGSFYFSEFNGHRVWRVTPDGTLHTLAGTGRSGLSGDGGAASAAQLSYPTALAVDPAGAVYVADSGNHRIRKVTNGIITTVGDSGRPGAAPALTVRTPTGLAVDVQGGLWVADSGAALLVKMTPAGVVASWATAARDLAIDGQGNLLFVYGSFCYRASIAAPTQSVIVAGSSAAAYTGDGGPAVQARLRQPVGLARDASGAIYIADAAAHRIRRVAPDGTIATAAGNGLAGIAGDGGPAVGAQLNSPQGLALDRAGSLFVGDTLNHRVRKITPGGNILTVAGSGIRGYSGDGPAIATQLDSPSSMAFDPSGTLLFADSGNNRIRAIAGSSVATLAGDGSAAVLSIPRGFVSAPDGTLWIADAGNQRLRQRLAGGTLRDMPGPWIGPWAVAVDGAGQLLVADCPGNRVWRVDLSGRAAAIAGDGTADFRGDGGPASTASLNCPTALVVDPAGNILVADSGNGRVRILTPSSTVIPPGAVSQLTIVNAASLQSSSVAPGEMVSIFGAGIGPSASATAQLDSQGRIATQLGGIQVWFNGTPAPLLYAGSNQINALVPYEVAGLDTADLRVVAAGSDLGRSTVGVASSSPAIFTVSNGSGQAAALNADGSPNSPDNPAPRGSVIVLYGTGAGLTDPDGVDGKLAAPPYPAPLLPVGVRIGDYDAEILYAGEAPGFAGLLQLNVRVPSGFAPSGSLAVVLRIGSLASQQSVTVAVR